MSEKPSPPTRRQKRTNSHAPLVTEGRVAQFDDSSGVRILRYQRGVVRLPEFVAPASPEHYANPSATLKPLELFLETLREMDEDTGRGTCVDVLLMTDLWMCTPERRGQLVEEIRAKVDDTTWNSIAPSVRFAPGHGQPTDPVTGGFISDPIVAGFWAALYLEPLTDEWLAAAAMYAEYAGHKFAFGYLTALLDQRRHAEPDFLRGRKGIESSRKGGEARAQRIRARSSAVLSAMEPYVATGHSPSRAGDFVFNRQKLGTSAAANAKLWMRHKS